MSDVVHADLQALSADDFSNLFEDPTIRATVELIVQEHNTPWTPNLQYTSCSDVVAHRLRSVIARKMGFDESITGTI